METVWGWKAKGLICEPIFWRTSWPITKCLAGSTKVLSSSLVAASYDRKIVIS